MATISYGIEITRGDAPPTTEWFFSKSSRDAALPAMSRALRLRVWDEEVRVRCLTMAGQGPPRVETKEAVLHERWRRALVLFESPGGYRRHAAILEVVSGRVVMADSVNFHKPYQAPEGGHSPVLEVYLAGGDSESAQGFWPALREAEPGSDHHYQLRDARDREALRSRFCPGRPA